MITKVGKQIPIKKLTKRNDPVMEVSKTPADMKVPPEGKQTVYVQKGLTLKIGEFEFARMDIGIIRNIGEDESFTDIVSEIADELDSLLEREAEKL